MLLDLIMLAATATGSAQPSAGDGGPGGRADRSAIAMGETAQQGGAKSSPPSDEYESPVSAAKEISEKGPSGTEVNGYLDSRSQFQRARVGQVLPTNDLAQLVELIEANVQLKHHYSAPGFVYADASAFGQLAGNFRGVGSDGSETAIPDHDVAAYRPLFSLNELYLSQDVSPTVNLLVGRKRVVWGPGFSFNPTDLINPPKDPTDPSFQRAGAWMTRAEVNLRTTAFTFLAAPGVTKQANGIPYAFVKYPSWDRQDDDAHYQIAARAYALVANSDLNLMIFYGNKYEDAFRDKLRIGASFSRYFLTDYELHMEALFQQGSARQYVNPDCISDAAAATACNVGHVPVILQPRLSEKTILPRVLVGARRQFDDDSLLNLEYYFQADGLSRSEFEQYVHLLELQGQTIQAATTGTSSTSGGIPQKFTFNPIGKHYLIASYAKPKIFDDWTAGLTLIANLADLSTLISPSVSWSAAQWLTLTLNGFVPASGPTSLSVTTFKGNHVGEYTLSPIQYRALFELRAFY